MAQARLEFIFIGFMRGEFQDRKTGEALPYSRVVLYDPAEVRAFEVKPLVPEGASRHAVISAMEKWAAAYKVGDKCVATYSIGTQMVGGIGDNPDKASVRFQWVAA